MLIRGYSNTRTWKQDKVCITSDTALKDDILPVEPSYQYIQYSKKFAWGIPDYGHRQLAFAILLHLCGARDAKRYYIAFSTDIVRNLFDLVFCLESQDIKNYVRRKKDQQTKWGRLYWKYATRFIFTNDFYEYYLKPAEENCEACKKSWNSCKEYHFSFTNDPYVYFFPEE